ncbi:hypothetical protein [Streptomyces sp. NBC_00893]|uniref:hypothetical protein n=1 Tax=Streptomyces sp. NBC_00893 TaxID=2975862 RepID=UPI0022538254|nr:hypothetical protein [Streptomyces sp. NBC_00893]MCX4850529.1 hypothetical protein [Streptomyces sp. NBC_00893]
MVLLDRVVDPVVAQLESDGAIGGLQENQTEATSGREVAVTTQFQWQTVVRVGMGLHEFGAA